MRIIDASSIVHAWDNYPLENFPTFWDWIAGEFSKKKLIVPKVAFDEVCHVSPDCSAWLSDRSFVKQDVSSAIAMSAVKIKGFLGIANDKYGTGVDENDIIIISTAKVLGHPLLSNEGRQPALPKNIKNYKMPAVCAMSGVGVQCLNVAEYIRQSKKVF